MIAEMRRQLVGLIGVKIASMGPRSNDRGNAFGERISHVVQEDASMGPRSNDRGNYVTAAGRESIGLLLQWGRDQMIAEISYREHVGDYRVWASMGPRSNDRGNDARTQERGKRKEASMGPRSNDRGNVKALVEKLDV